MEETQKMAITIDAVVPIELEHHNSKWVCRAPSLYISVCEDTVEEALETFKRNINNRLEMLGEYQGLSLSVASFGKLYYEA